MVNPAEDYDRNGSEIAIIGMVGRFPGASTLDAFWRNLCAGHEAITMLRDGELDPALIEPAGPDDPRYVKAAALLDGVEQFDAAFFGYTPREAEIMDPQQRLFLECAWEALEQAGYCPDNYPDPIGVFAGARTNTYLFNICSRGDLLASLGAFQIGLGNDLAFLAARTSYKLNLRGPSYAVHTACSTGLAAIHLACQSLLIGECRIALAGGVAINVPQRAGYVYQEGGILSPDGHCRAFDAEAQGTVFGSGVGVVVLKRLEQALADRDTIHAVIKGSAVNNDGAQKANFTAPSVYGQAGVILDALASAEVHPDTIGYVEAHGTGTPLGDPIEVRALSRAFRRRTARRNFCALGSVKSNLGHLDAAAGVAGLFKVVLALRHGQIPPAINYRRPNPQIDFAGSPFYVNDQLAPWPEGPAPRRAAVSSFGIGGTNAHLILEQTPMLAPSGPARAWQVLPLSARTATALEAAARNLAAALRVPTAPLADVAYTLQVGRSGFNHRRVVVCRDHADALRALETGDTRQVISGFRETDNPPVVFLFPGQGAQHSNMARDLYEAEPVFREHVDRCAGLLRPHLGLDLRTVLYPQEQRIKNKEQIAQNQEPRTENREPPITRSPVHPFTRSPAHPLTRSELDQTELAQPALFVVEYALAQLWQSWGVRPHSLIGHSVGEWVAACLAGVFSLEDALALVAARGRLMQQCTPGAMLAVSLAERELAPQLGPDLALAAVNGPLQCVAAGSCEAVAALERRLVEQGITCRRLPTAHAFHSTLVEPVLDAFAVEVGRVMLHPPQIPLISNVTGTWLEDEQATDPGYWARHLRATVRFADGLQTLGEDPGQILLEVGPGKTLSSLARRQGDFMLALASLPHPDDSISDAMAALRTLGMLWSAGVAVDWAGFASHERRRRVPLPTYPFERQPYWIAPQLAPTGPAHGDREKQADIGDWFYLPGWRRAALPKALDTAGLAAATRRWLVFADTGPLSGQLVDQLERLGQQVMIVRAGDAFDRLPPRTYTIAPGRRDDYRQLLEDVCTGGAPDHVIHLWSMAGMPAAVGAPFDERQETGLYSLLWLTQALDGTTTGGVQLHVITSGTAAVRDTEMLCPMQAPLLGLCKVIPQEHAAIACEVIDVLPGENTPAQAGLLLAEMLSGAPEASVAYRAGRRWVAGAQPLRIAPDAAPLRPLRECGVYLITGGLGGIGLLLAEELARLVHARLVLVGRSSFPPPADWPAWLAGHGMGDPISRKIRALQAIENHGGELLLVQADVARADQMRWVVEATRERFGALHGVIHAAGITSATSVFTPIALLDRPDFAAQFQAKVHGVYVLEEVLADQPLDFCALFSSNAAVLGVLGFAAYAAANAFMDSFAANRAGERPWMSINWDRWPEDPPPDGRQSGVDRYSMTRAESLDAFRRAVTAAPEGQLIVSTAALPERLAAWVRRSFSGGDHQGPGGAAARQARPLLPTSYVAPRGPEEAQIAMIWQDILGVADIGVHDNFFDLEGDSLRAMQLIGRVRGAFDVELPLSKFYVAPTVAGMTAALGTLHKAQHQRITPRVAREIAPLSFAQQRFWFLDQFEPNSAAYIMSTAVRLSGPLDNNALQASIDAIVRRHDVLRASFADRDGLPVQTIAPPHGLPLVAIDLSQHTPGEREDETRRLAAIEAARPFDLSAGPLLRATLLRHSQADHVLLLSIHHIASDAWSMGVFIQELVAGYQAHIAGGTQAVSASLPPLPIQYADFAAWQQEWLQGERLETQRDYWRRQLAGAPALLNLPTDRPRSAARGWQGAVLPVRIPRALTDALKALGRGRQTTLFTTLLAAFQVLLARYSGQDDIIVGTPVAGRVTSETEPLIGLFTNTLALRTDLSDDPGFLQALDRAQQKTTAAYAHQDVPFDYVVRDLQSERPIGALPLVQVAFTLQNAPMPLHLVESVALTFLDAQHTTAQFDLALNLWESPEGLEGEVEYSTELFDRATIERMLVRLLLLIEQIIARPERPISAIPLITAAERAALTQPDPQPVAPAPAASIHQWFEQVVQRAPAATALSGPDGAWSYAGLNRRANRIAHLLRSLGVGPERCVGVCLDRSRDLVAALLGVLKAGGAYVPLDPVLPSERRAFMLRDAGCPVLLADRAALGPWQPAGVTVVCLDDAAALAGQPADDPLVTVAPDHLAYVIYTSGSTGQPKGVLVTHANVLRLFAATRPWFAFGPEDVWTLFHAVSFDFSVWELWGALLYGGRLVIVPYVTSRSPGEFHALLDRERVTVLNQTPSAFQQLMQVDAAAAARLPALRLVIFGGEALRLQELSGWFERHGDQRPQLVNMYGITETTVHVTYATLHAGHVRAAAGSPIGGAIPDLRIYLLDSALQPVPPGIPGELYIGGAGLARGYLNRPELTAERFVPNPFAENKEQRTKNKEPREENQEPHVTLSPAHPLTRSPAHDGSRLYRTGDRARYLPDGTLEYLGRIDQQVKIRGYRIELGEIEAALRWHPAVRACVVLARPDQQGTPRLVGYLTLEEGRSKIEDGRPTEDRGLKVEDSSADALKELSSLTQELRVHLAKHLPDYMIPAAFVVLDALPLTHNGKLDRRALPEPDMARPRLEVGFVAPRTPLEAAIAGVWAAVLGLEQVGIHDNFFNLGGHSLLATQAVTQLRHAYQLDLTLRKFFETPTVAELAETIVEGEIAQADSTEISALLATLDGLSADEIDALLAEKPE